MKGYKIRIYPTKEQEQMMWEHIGACRFIWNYMLDLQETRHKAGEKHLSAFDMINLLTPLKHDGEHEWLNEVSNASLQATCRDLDKSYSGFFKKNARHPKFKSRKRSKPAYPVRTDVFYIKDGGTMAVSKIGEVKYKTDFDLPAGRNVCRFSNVRVSNDNRKWYISFGMECENQAPVLTDKMMGIDLGVKELATVAFGDEQITYRNINKSRKVRALERKSRRLQRGISRKYEKNRRGNAYVKTRNIEREEEKLGQVRRKLANIRQNYTHQTTHALVSMLPKRVVMEDLNVIGMMKNRHLSRAIQEQNFAEFIRQMKYKCEWNGIEFIQAGKLYPSSKTCSNCGNVKHDLRLRDRTYKCEVCGAVIDRDFNAALNLSRYVA